MSDESGYGSRDNDGFPSGKYVSKQPKKESDMKLFIRMFVQMIRNRFFMRSCNSKHGSYTSILIGSNEESEVTYRLMLLIHLKKKNLQKPIIRSAL